MKKIAEILASFISFILWWAVVYFLWFQWLLLFGIPCVIWAIFGNWYSKKIDKPNKLTKIIAWSNLVTWIIPIVWLLTSVSTISLSKLDKKYTILWYIWLIAALINAIVGVALRIDFSAIDWSQWGYELPIVIVALGIINVIRDFSKDKNKKNDIKK